MPQLVRSLMFLIVLSHFAFGQMQVAIFQPANISANSLLALTVEVKNIGALDRTQVRASLSSLDANVKVSNGYAYIGIIGKESAQNVSFAFVLGNRSGMFPMQVIVHDSSDSLTKNFSISITGGVSYASTGDSTSEAIFQAYQKVSTLNSMYSEISGNAAECPATEFEKANQSYSLAKGYLSRAQSAFANKSYSAAGQNATRSSEWADSASAYGKRILESQKECIAAKRLLRLEQERANFYRNISMYKRSLSNLHVLIGFLEGRDINMSLERGVEKNVAENINTMEKLVDTNGSMFRAIEIANSTEMLLSATPSLLESRLSVIDGAIGDADYKVALAYLKLEDAEKQPAFAYSGVTEVSGRMQNAQSSLEMARATLGNAKAYVSYKDFLFFSASAIGKLQEAEKTLYDSGIMLGRLSDVADYKLSLGKFVLVGLFIVLVLGIALAAFLHQRGKWRLVESVRGFHYKKRS